MPLHVHSHFSLLRGASSVEELVARAAALGYRSLALTDRDALYGAVRFTRACASAGLHPVVGCEVTLESGHHLTLLAENQTGYGNLCRLVSLAHRDQPKGTAALAFDQLAHHATGLIALSGPGSGEIPGLLRAGRRSAAVRAAQRYREVFGDRFLLEIQNQRLPDDAWLMAEVAALGGAQRVDLVATTDVHYHDPSRRMIQDVLTGIRTRTTLAVPSPERLPNGHFALPAPDELRQLFRHHPGALERTDELARRCQVSLDFRAARFPPLDLPDGQTPDQALGRLCWEGARARYRPLTERVRRQLAHELAVVARAGLAPFFLIAADVARRYHGRCRGSAAGSLIVYCLGVSACDPLRYGMLFERFINPERPTLPDIDVDFSEWDREAAIAYCYQTYGWERTAMVCNYVRFRARSAVRDVGRTLGMPPDLLDRLAKALDHAVTGDALVAQVAAFSAARDGDPQPWPLLTRLCQEIDDCPRHLSIHVGGMLLTGQPLVELFGLEPARKEGIVVVGGDKEDIEDAGLGKLDLLCLRALSVIQEAVALERARGIPLDLRTINLEDPAIYWMLREADTVGASQVESRAQMQSVVRTQPRCFRDLINQCAIIRPGPIVAGMVHPFNRRRLGLEKVTYPHPLLAPILQDTLGIFLFQEQIILGVMALTGCSAGEADVFRRAMGSHRSREAMTKLEPWFRERATANGVDPSTAVEVFRQISGFADFGFCKSHSAALARTAYEGMYLKRYHPAAFYAALLSNQPLGFYPTEVLVWDGRRHGVTFRPVDANRSGARCTLDGDPPAIRLGFAQVRGVGAQVACRVVAERDAHGPFEALHDFTRRTGLVGPPVEGLVLAGAFAFERRSREEQLWEVYGQVSRPGQPSLHLPEEPPALPGRSVHEQVALDHLVLGFSLDHHLVAGYRRRLRALGVVTSDKLDRWPAGTEVRVGGLVVCRQRPATAKGFVFLTIEDETGLVNVIVRPDVYQQYRDPLRNHALVAVVGTVQRAFGTVNVVARRAVALDPITPRPDPSPTPGPVAASVRAHDFH
ncbi:MAG: DNA polymerase III subunit alpha [Chloroflexota bacterium]